MKAKYLLGILLTIGIGMILMRFFCCAVEVTESPKESTPPIETKTRFEVKDDGFFILTNEGSFNFNRSEFSILTPVSENIDTGIERLQTYLSQSNHSKKIVTITGLYDGSETNTSAFPNLGLARANAIKSYFTSKGILSKRINIKGAQKEGLRINDLVYEDPVTYSIEDQKIDLEAQELTILKEKIINEPLIIYFENGQTSIHLSVDQRKKIADISRYLDKIEGSSITIEGHTDDTGSRSTNIDLGYTRADFIKGYFVNNGISETKIRTSSKGQDSPIASNLTEEGRSQNRRAIVILNDDNNSKN